MLPQLQDDPPASMGAMPNGYADHPVIQDREKVDLMRQSGIPAETAHQQVYGDIDLADTNSKKELAATLGRVQDDGNKKGIKLEKDKEFKSLLAIDDEITNNMDTVTSTDLRTPQGQELPDAVQDPQATPLAQEEEYDYNLDVAYLQKFGRA